MRVAAIARVILAILFLAPPAAVRAGKNEPRPYPLTVDVVWGDPVGPETWREDLERHVLQELVDRHCFTSVGRFDPEREPAPPLVLRVQVDDYLEQTTYGVGISALEAPDADPETKQSLVAEIKALFQLRLVHLPGGGEVRQKHFADRVTYRPVMGEDPRFIARTRLLESARRTIASFVCKGSAAAFEKQLTQAR